jgi:hypothetical protein
MASWRPVLLLGVILAGPLTVLQGKSSPEIDVTRRQPSPAEQRAPAPDVQSPRVAEGFIDRRFQTRTWEGGTSRFNQRRASIQVQETRPKRMVDVPRVEHKTIPLATAPQSGRMASVRNFDHVRENQIAPSMRDPVVVNVQQAVRPAPTNKEGGELTMRDANRFTFKRNSYEDAPLRVQRAGSGEAAP